MKAALYARVSTGSQDPEPQLAALKEYVQRRGWDLAGEYVDVGSGRNGSRPNLIRLQQDAFRHDFDVVVVWKFDRFARSVSHLLRALEKFKTLRIEFVSMTEQLDTGTPTGKMILTVLGGVAELELDIRRERVSLGMAAAKAQGKGVCRPLKAVNEEKIRRDYQTLHSLGKVAALNNCSTWLVSQIVRGTRSHQN